MGDIDQKKRAVTTFKETTKEYFETNATKWGTNTGREDCLELYGPTGLISGKKKTMRGVV